MLSDLSLVTLTCGILCAVGSSPVLDAVFFLQEGDLGERGHALRHPDLSGEHESQVSTPAFKLG